MYSSSPEQLQQHLPQQPQKQASNHNQLVKIKVQSLSRGTAQSVFTLWCGVTAQTVFMLWCGGVRCGTTWCGVVWCSVMQCGVE